MTLFSLFSWEGYLDYKIHTCKKWDTGHSCICLESLYGEVPLTASLNLMMIPFVLSLIPELKSVFRGLNALVLLYLEPAQKVVSNWDFYLEIWRCLNIIVFSNLWNEAFDSHLESDSLDEISSFLPPSLSFFLSSFLSPFLLSFSFPSSLPFLFFVFLSFKNVSL